MGRISLGPAAFGTNPEIAVQAFVRTDSEALRTPEVRALFERHILDCLAAGSDFLATDTFPARRLLQVSGKDFAELVREHLAIISDLYRKLGLKLPMSLLAFGPVGDCYLADADCYNARECAAEQIGLGVGKEAQSSIDSSLLGVLFETVPSREKLFGTVEAILARVGGWPKGHIAPPFTVSLVVADDGNFRDSESAAQCVHDLFCDKRVLRLCREGKLKFGLNCVDVKGALKFWSALKVLDSLSNVEVSSFVDYFAPNGAEGNAWDAEEKVGRGEEVLVNGRRPRQIVDLARAGIFKRVAVCCGLGCEHLHEVSDFRRLHARKN